MKETLKYKNHIIILTIRNQWKNRAGFSFAEVDQKEVEVLILNQDANKVSQSSDIPLKILKDNPNNFSGFSSISLNSSVKLTIFPKS